jgi:hypothetical protein
MKSIAKFATEYSYVSVLLTLALMVYAYWEIIKLRYSSGFFESVNVSNGGQELFLAGFKNSMSTVVTSFLPVAIILLFAILVAYTLYNSYAHTLYDLDVNANYVNVKKVHTMHIVMHYTSIYTATFVVSLLFWSVYFTYIFPRLVKIPLSYIIGTSTLKFLAVCITTFVALVLIAQFGLVLTRLTKKILNKR